jgi:hypothetical protein
MTLWGRVGTKVNLVKQAGAVLAGFDFGKLTRRADDQLASVETQRVATAQGAFAG